MVTKEESWIEEYEKRATENIQACEKIAKRKLSEDERQAIGIMVYRQMKAEKKDALPH